MASSIEELDLPKSILQRILKAAVGLVQERTEDLSALGPLERPTYE